MSTIQSVTENTLCLADFLLDVQSANRAPRTIYFYQQKLEMFLTFLATQGATTSSAITPQLLRQFLVQLQKNHTSGGVHAFYRAIRAFIRFLVREGVLYRNPLDRLRRLQIEQPLLEPLPHGTITALLDACDASEKEKRDEAIFLTLLDSEIRAGELTALAVGDVNLKNGSIAIRKEQQGASCLWGTYQMGRA